jgi:hypothetical protein
MLVHSHSVRTSWLLHAVGCGSCGAVAACLHPLLLSRCVVECSKPALRVGLCLAAPNPRHAVFLAVYSYRCRQNCECLSILSG